MEDRHYPHYLHPLARRLGKTYSVVETGMKELTVKGINNQHNKTYQFDRSESCTCVEKLSSPVYGGGSAIPIIELYHGLDSSTSRR